MYVLEKLRKEQRVLFELFGKIFTKEMTFQMNFEGWVGLFQGKGRGKAINSPD